MKFLPTLPILPWVRVVFSDSRKLNVRGNWRVIRVSQLRRLAAAVRSRAVVIDRWNSVRGEIEFDEVETVAKIVRK